MRRALNTPLDQRRLGEGLALSAFVFLLLILLGLGRPAHAADQTILNVSYDPTRELYQEYNAAFAKHWKAKTGDIADAKAQRFISDSSPGIGLPSYANSANAPRRWRSKGPRGHLISPHALGPTLFFDPLVSRPTLRLLSSLLMGNPKCFRNALNTRFAL